MDKQEHDNILDIFTRQKRTTDMDIATHYPYHALLGDFYTDELKGSEEFIIIRREDGRETELIRYADILSVYCPTENVLGITCEHAYFQFEGQQLDAVPFHIQTRKLEILQLYVPEWHLEPGEDAPIISRITRDPEFITDDDLAEIAVNRQDALMSSEEAK